MPPTRRVTDRPVNEVAEKRREPEQKEAPLFDPKARGAALRAAFLKAAHPEVALEAEASTEPEAEPGQETDSLPEAEPKPDTEVDSKLTDNAVDETVLVASEPTLPPDATSEPVAKEQKGAEETVGETKSSDKTNKLEEEAKNEDSDTLAAEPTDDAVDVKPVDTPNGKTEDESRKEESEESDIKPQIERELFAEYVVFEEEDHENQPDAEQAPSENEPTPEPNADEPESASESTDSSNEASPEEEVASPAPVVDEKPVPAPEPIIEEVKATVIDEPPVEQENNQVVVKPQKLGFFARLKLLFFGGKKH